MRGLELDTEDISESIHDLGEIVDEIEGSLWFFIYFSCKK